MHGILERESGAGAESGVLIPKPIIQITGGLVVSGIRGMSSERVRIGGRRRREEKKKEGRRKKTTHVVSYDSVTKATESSAATRPSS